MWRIMGLSVDARLEEICYHGLLETIWASQIGDAILPFTVILLAQKFPNTL